jgi:hypothetical protein
VLPFGGPVARQDRNLLGDEKTAVGSEAFEYDFFE